ncbi:MAG: ATP-dependent Clp protease ATP-binding subunit ClpX [Lachnospiraceae bacterium]|nr:ATP-dependent Clp protease ATP-binding subunit ClpX [Lachnospiraceae bacterium]
MEDYNQNDNGYESICSVCRRSESVAGKMLKMPGNTWICNDCMQKTMDMVNAMDLGPYMNGEMPPMGGFGMPFGFAMPGQPKPEASQTEEKKDADSVVESGDTDSEDQPTKEDKKDDDKSKDDNVKNVMGGMPRFSFLNMNDLLGGGFSGSRKVKKKKKGEYKPLIELKDIPAPHEIRAKLDEYVIGQDMAKKAISVAVYNHYKRVATGTQEDIEIEKSNMLMIGPTGSGKTYLVRTLAKILNVPLAITDATSLTEAGYIGDDIESVVSKLLAAADNDVNKAEQGIIFIDEIDKLAKKANSNTRDVSGESVQQGMLKLLEGADIEVPIGSSSKNAMVPTTIVNTSNILFICAGAFAGLDEIIKKRLNKQNTIGFAAELKDKFDKENVLAQVKTEDIRKFGMIPEFIGRLPMVITLESLTKDMYVQILSEPKNAILKQYQKLLELDEVRLVFSEDCLEAIAEKASQEETGARALRAIIDKFMLDIMYEIPKDKNIGTVTITKAYIEGSGGPVIEMRG